MRGYLLGILTVSALASAACSGRGAAGGTAVADLNLTLFALGEVRGQI